MSRAQSLLSELAAAGAKPRRVQPMSTPRIRNLPNAIKGMIDALDQRAGEVMDRASKLSDRGNSAFTATEAVIKEGEEAIAAIEDFAGLTSSGGNGGPRVSPTETGSPASSTSPASSAPTMERTPIGFVHRS